MSTGSSTKNADRKRTAGQMGEMKCWLDGPGGNYQVKLLSQVEALISKNLGGVGKTLESFANDQKVLERLVRTGRKVSVYDRNGEVVPLKPLDHAVCSMVQFGGNNWISISPQGNRTYRFKGDGKTFTEAASQVIFGLEPFKKYEQLCDRLSSDEREDASDWLARVKFMYDLFLQTDLDHDHDPGCMEISEEDVPTVDNNEDSDSSILFVSPKESRKKGMSQYQLVDVEAQESSGEENTEEDSESGDGSEGSDSRRDDDTSVKPSVKTSVLTDTQQLWLHTYFPDGNWSEFIFDLPRLLESFVDPLVKIFLKMGDKWDEWKRVNQNLFKKNLDLRSKVQIQTWFTNLITSRKPVHLLCCALGMKNTGEVQDQQGDEEEEEEGNNKKKKKKKHKKNKKHKKHKNKKNKKNSKKNSKKNNDRTDTEPPCSEDSAEF
jgi:hypothetical protein